MAALLSDALYDLIEPVGRPADARALERLVVRDVWRAEKRRGDVAPLFLRSRQRRKSAGFTALIGDESIPV